MVRQWSGNCQGMVRELLKLQLWLSVSSAAASQLSGRRLSASSAAASQLSTCASMISTLRMGSFCTGMGTCHMAMRVLSKSNEHIQVVHEFAVDSSSDCIKMIKQNFANQIKSIVHSCMSKLDIDSLPYVDILAAGFPCQPWSAANRKRKGVSDPRASVVLYILKYIERRKPKLVILENVCGLVYKYRAVMDAIKAKLDVLGYSVSWKILDSKKVGYVPQSRRRWYLVAVHAAAVSPSAAVSLSSLWPQQVPMPALASILENQPCISLPSAPKAKAKVIRVLQVLKQKGVDPRSIDDLVVNCNSIGGRPSKSYTPCLTASRGASKGFWIISQCRMMTRAELMKLQGMHPALFDWGDISQTKSGHMIGNAFTLSVFVRVLAAMLPASGLVGRVRDPYARFMQKD